MSGPGTVGSVPLPPAGSKRIQRRDSCFDIQNGEGPQAGCNGLNSEAINSPRECGAPSVRVFVFPNAEHGVPNSACLEARLSPSSEKSYTGALSTRSEITVPNCRPSRDRKGAFGGD